MDSDSEFEYGDQVTATTHNTSALYQQRVSAHRVVSLPSQWFCVAHPRVTEAMKTTVLLKMLSITPMQTYRDPSHDYVASLQLLPRRKYRQATSTHLCMSHHLQASIMLKYQYHQVPNSLYQTWTNKSVTLHQPHRSMHYAMGNTLLHTQPSAAIPTCRWIQPR